MTQHYHQDSIQLDRSRAIIRGDGTLVVPARLTRAGVLTYHDANGKPRRRLRHAADVLAPDRVAALGGLPVTLEHPPEMVTPGNASRYAVGTVDLSTSRDGMYAAGTLMIHDQRAIDAIMKGTHGEISPGYWASIVQESGIYDGEAYDDRQTGQRWNHIALVPSGRSGSQVRVMLDSGDAGHVDDCDNGTQPSAWTEALMTTETKTETNDEGTAGAGWATMVLDTADGAQSLKLRPSQIEVISGAIAAKDAEIKRLRDEAAAAKGRGDAAEQAVKDAEDKHAKALDAAKAEAEARAFRIATLRAEHREFCGQDPQQDAADVDMQKAVIAKLSPGFSLDGREPASVAAVYQYVTEQARKAAAADAGVRKALDSVPGDTKIDSTAAAVEGLYKAAAKR